MKAIQLISTTAILTLTPLIQSQEIVTKEGDSKIGSDHNSGQSRFEVTADKDSSRASFKLSRILPQSKLGESQTASAIVSAPLKKAEDLTSIANLDSFVNSSTIEFKWSSVNYKNATRRPSVSVLEQLEEEYLGAVQEGWKKDSKGQGKPTHVDSNLVYTFAKSKFEEFQANFFSPNGNALLYGVSATIGYEEFEYRTLDTLEKNTSKKSPYGAKLYLGIKPMNRNSIYTFSFEHQTGFKASDSFTVLTPQEGNEQVFKSETSPIAPPIENDTNKLSWEARSLVKMKGSKQPVGISLKVSHDFERKEYAVLMPIYLLRNKDDKLTGGFQFQWSESAGASFAFFVGKPFTIFE